MSDISNLSFLTFMSALSVMSDISNLSSCQSCPISFLFGVKTQRVKNLKTLSVAVPPSEVLVNAEERGGLVNLTCLAVGAYPAPQARLFWSTG